MQEWLHHCSGLQTPGAEPAAEQLCIALQMMRGPRGGWSKVETMNEKQVLIKRCCTDCNNLTASH